MASSDEWVRVMSITSEHAAESRLVSMGINPGALLHVISASGRGPIVVARDETRFGIDRKTAWHVRVVPASPDAMHAPYPSFCDDNCRGCSYRSEMMKAEYGESVTLGSLKPGESGVVISVRGRGVTVTRLMKLGLVRGAGVTMLERLSDPDRFLIEVQGRKVEMAGWDALHVILEKAR
jgi:Fe2+ transport system protein FeoA